MLKVTEVLVLGCFLGCSVGWLLSELFVWLVSNQ
jgi:hypothetical protein